MSDTPDQQAKWLVGLADFLGERDQSFACNCEPTIEYDVNAVIHTDACATNYQDHADVVLRQAAQLITQQQEEIERLQSLLDDRHAQVAALLERKGGSGCQ